MMSKQQPVLRDKKVVMMHNVDQLKDDCIGNLLLPPILKPAIKDLLETLHDRPTVGHGPVKVALLMELTHTVIHVQCL